MNPARGLSAAALLAKTKADEIAKWLAENSDEPHAAPLATAIATARPQTTTQLAEVVRKTLASVARRLSTDEVATTVRRVFQAIRIAVNDEFGALETFLRQLPHCLKPGGRVAILTFHSGEDRRVKLAFKFGLQAGRYAAINDEVVRASPEEQRANPRSTSAKLRWAVAAAAARE
jgi:16S rRNA (cytosine1402-N4)-methyltransferase